MNSNKIDVVALGELLIDFTEYGKSSQGNKLFEANPGGAPCNVLAMLQKLNKSTAFIGKIGDDQFGRMLCETISSLGIGADGLVFDSKIPTTLAFVGKNAEGDREFSFYRNPGADMMLNKDEIKEEIISNAKIFHFGTLSMTHESVREATLSAIKIAKENGAIISLDPNLRELLWDSLDDAKKQMKEALKYCDVLKISDNEIEFLTGVSDFDEGVNIIRKDYNIPLICVTMGKEGSIAYYKDIKVVADGFYQENVVDTTGAGDTFCGCVLSYICEKGLNDLSADMLSEMITFANAAASLVTTKAGAIKSMPELSDIQLLIDKNRR
ncbi:MAG: carbohydrate kinase [Lachnospiraceae bacterium]|nr:carbohydrate kinase [Lachnospiraceae bacterium]